MSKFIPDPQIQSLRPMRAGDIAFASGGTITVGKLSVAVLTPNASKSPAPAAAESVHAPVGTPSESPLIGMVKEFTLSFDSEKSISMIASDSVPALSGTPSESPVIGVGKSTSVS